MSEQVRTRSWTRKEYDRLIEVGFFQADEPIELVAGQLMVCEPKGPPHAVSVEVTADALRRAFGPGWSVRTQGPVALDDESEPEPDVAVVPGEHRDYGATHPARPVLVVEVAESSLLFDRRDRGSLYARAGLPDYWLVNLVDRVVEVYRTPTPTPAAPYGWAYREVERLGPEATVSPLAIPGTVVRVRDLLP
jgi:Uma2 family endonuclease